MAFAKLIIVWTFCKTDIYQNANECNIMQLCVNANRIYSNLCIQQIERNICAYSSGNHNLETEYCRLVAEKNMWPTFISSLSSSTLTLGLPHSTEHKFIHNVAFISLIAHAPVVIDPLSFWLFGLRLIRLYGRIGTGCCRCVCNGKSSLNFIVFAEASVDISYEW